MKYVLPVIVSLFSVTTAWSANYTVSLNTKMADFKMPPGYDCPLFSNSPYADMLSALDKMQDNLNQVFPQCENKSLNESAVTTSIDLRNKIFQAQKLQSTGQTYKLGSVADSIVTLTAALQKSLVTLSASKTSACYRSEAQFRSVIFSINDTFQSMSPLVLDLVSKNPALGQSLGPALKIFAGADAISKSLTMIEQIAKDSVQFDMSNPELRINTVRNICQFMKLYNRLDSLRLYRRGEIASISDKFVAEIREKNQKVDALKKALNPNVKLFGASAIGAQGAALMTEADDDQPIYTDEAKLEYYNKLRAKFSEIQNQTQSALGTFTAAQTDDQYPEISQCQAVSSTLNNLGFTTYKKNLEKFAAAINHRSDYRLQLDIIRAYEADLQEALKQGDRARCARLGSDYLKKLDFLMVTADGILADYENKLISEKGEAYVFQHQLLAAQQAEVLAVESNYANLKTMLNYVAFESSEVEKRAKGIHKYLFAGPDKVESECRARTGDKACSFTEGIAGLAKAYYQEYRNQGPVFELILNNEKYFNDSLTKMANAMLKIQRYEDQFVPAPKSTPSLDQKTFNAYIEARDVNAFSMPHFTSQFLIKGTAAHAQLCLTAKLAADQYVIAATHMMSSVGLCNIIKNVLGQPEVSVKLKNYCVPVSDKTPSGIDQLRFKLVGEYDGTTTGRQGAITRLFARSPKAFIDQVLNRYSTLDCD